MKKTSGLTKINGRTKNAITIKYVPLDKIKPWGKNPKKHDKEQIRISIERYGFRDPIAVNRKNDEVEAGHGRLSVIAEMMKEGAEPPAGIQVAHGVWKVPVIYFDDDEITQYKYAIMHNRSTELGGWNNKTLAGVLKEIFASDDMIGTGFDDDIFKVDLGKGVIDEGDKPEYPIEQVFSEKYDYVIIFCRNEIDFTKLRTIFDLKPKQSYKSSEVGVGRVVTFEEFEELWNSR